ncbi:hypothetical protein ABW20_dc0105232 [Dactylellina cionopaga]|nr:hypothetical protein ABW20_dc0105232 [Dactylellina cionopaga]
MAAEDDYFGDDDDFLDNLDELQEIENAAVLASLTQKQQQQPPPQSAAPQPPKNPYQISSKAAAYNSSGRIQNQSQSHAGPSRAHANPTFQPPRPVAPLVQPKTSTSVLSEEEQAVRAAFVARNRERQRLRQQQQETYLAQQKPQEQTAQQEVYLAEQRQAQLSQSTNYSHRQRQLQPRASYRQPTPSYITQPTLPSSPADRLRLPNGGASHGQGSTVKKPAHGTGNANTTSNGTTTTTADRYQTAKSNAQAQNVSIARPEEYATYDESEELWDTAAPTEMVLQEADRTAIIDPSILGTSAFGTSAWISSNDQSLLLKTASHNVTNDDMVDYDAEVEKDKANETTVMDVDEAPKGPTAAQLEELEALRRAAQQLAAEKEELQKKLKQVTVDVQTKTGENLILRKKMEKSEAEYKSEVEALRSFAQQKHEKSEKDMASLRTEIAKMQANLDFDHNDQDEMRRELKQYQEKDRQTVRAPKDAGLMTPRKSKLSAFRDGFDDDEAGMSMRSSPPVGAPGSRGRGTPSKSAKRKRKPNESPMKNSQTLMLPILQSGNNSQRSFMMENGQESEEDEYAAMIDNMTLEDLGLSNDDRQQFLENILSYKPEGSELTILEVLEQYHFLSDEETSLSALFMENIPQAEVDAEYGEFPAKVCCILIALWDRCYVEKFFEPLSLILDFLYHVMTRDFGLDLFPIVMEPFAEVLQKTVMLNSLERFKGHNDRINPLVDVEKCLLLFETVALGVLTDEGLAKFFWTHIQPDFIAPFMTFNQPLSHIRLVLNTLPSSVFTSSYGPISPDPLQQKDYERVTLIHASFLLTTEPKPDATAHPGLRRAEVLSIRSAILTFYACIASTDYGITSLVTNSNWQALSRIIVRLHHELEEIYEDRYNCHNSVGFVNNGVALIHRVLKLQKSNDGIERLLSNSSHNGNGHKHLVVFARVAFIREKGYLREMGVLQETVDMAMEVLEGSVTMEQGDEIWGLFRGRPGGLVGEASMTESMMEADRILREEEMKG